MVDRDFNHPSVILYSIGNEVSEPAEQKGIDLGKELIADFHHLDNSRPVTGGINLMIVAMSAKGKGVYDGKGTAAPMRLPRDLSIVCNSMRWLPRWDWV